MTEQTKMVVVPPTGIDDPMTAALIEKGYVPHVRFDGAGNMLELHWEKPLKATSGIGPVEAFVLVACLLFALFIIKGVPWG